MSIKTSFNRLMRRIAFGVLGFDPDLSKRIIQLDEELDEALCKICKLTDERDMLKKDLEQRPVWKEITRSEMRRIDTKAIIGIHYIMEDQFGNRKSVECTI
jgi:hypothetical protein